MAFIGLRGGKTKFNWHREGLRRLIGEAAAKALQRSGLEVRKSTQRSMVGGGSRTGRKQLARPRFWVVGQRDGYNMVALIRQVPRPDKVSSWGPQAFLRNDIQSDWDNNTKSVVVGPSRAPWLNQLHEFGGSVPLYFVGSKAPVTSVRGARIPTSVMREPGSASRGRGSRSARRRGAYVGYLTNQPSSGAVNLGSRRVRGRAYMEYGLQASINKIPEQFRNSIRRSGGSI